MLRAMHEALADQLIHSLLRSPAGGFQFKPGALDAIREAAAGLESGEELYGVLQELLRFANFLAGPKRSRAPAEALLAIVEELAEKLTGLARGDAAATGQHSEAVVRQVEQQRKALTQKSPASDGLAAPGSGVGLRSGKLPRGGG